MPGWKAHLAVGLICAALAAYLGRIALSPALVLLAAVASLAPDLDHSKAKLSQYLHMGIVIGSAAFFFSQGPLKTGYSVPVLQHWLVMSFLSAGAVLGVLWLARNSILRHRSITHSVVGTLVFAGLVWLATQNLSLLLVGGVAYTSHWLLDGELRAT